MIFIVDFFFNHTATTEIYTYLHPLSLPDALPILVPAHCRLILQPDGPPEVTGPMVHLESTRRFESMFVAGHWLLPQSDQRAPVVDPATRSEEHTSELQSLMRISYAVFCLKKQNINN